MTGTARVAGIVLAAGQATRFGATKQRALLHGRPLVVHVAETAQHAGLSPVLVVTGHDAQAVMDVLPPGVQAVHNPAFGSGQASSLRAGITAAQTAGADAAVVLLADQPGMTATAIRAVVAAHALGAMVARARYTDRSGHPVLFDRTIWPAMQDLQGDAGARDLLRTLEVTDVAIPERYPPDIDHPDDLPTP